MADLKQCEFFLLRYVPDAVKNEFVNIGVVLTSPNGGAELRMTRDWSRVRCLDPAADVEMLEAIEAEMRTRLNAGDEDKAAMIKKLDDSFSNILQVSETKACFAEDPLAEVETLARLYLQSERKEKLSRDAGARVRIFNRMRTAFEKAGVWNDPRMWKKVPVGELANNGDPLKIDCGYRPNGIVHLFHAVSLETDMNAAKVLAYSLPALQAAILKKEKAGTELTAVVEANVDRRDEQVAFALRTLERAAIKIAGTDRLPALAEQARKELKL
jgi:hypothetical protein